ncbi:MAG: GNAT family N-acetyltransferase [Ruminococcaceae bacterium]|nr:GNAT family N-acetyltransferase [Oscillospiraceae bacterium]
MMQKDTVYKTFKRIPSIETDRLILRKLKVSDFEDMYEYSKSDEVTKYLLWRSHPDEQYTRDYLKYIQSRYRAGDFFDWALEHKETGKMIGTCGFAKLDYDNNSAEIGYVINPAFWHKGYASEAVKKVIDFGFHTLNLHRIEARYIVGNEFSRKVMEKCGMIFEGIHRSSLMVKDSFVSVGYCAITADDYISNYL